MGHSKKKKQTLKGLKMPVYESRKISDPICVLVSSTFLRNVFKNTKASKEPSAKGCIFLF